MKNDNQIKAEVRLKVVACNLNDITNELEMEDPDENESRRIIAANCKDNVNIEGPAEKAVI